MAEKQKRMRRRKFRRYIPHLYVYCLMITQLVVLLIPTLPQMVWGDVLYQQDNEQDNNREIFDFIGAKELWNQMEDIERAPGKDIVVAVIDTGVSIFHPDLKDNIWTNESELYGQAGIDDDENGYVDDIHGVNIIDGPGMTDVNGHGTMMAGIIAMQAGNGGGIGIAYQTKIMPIKIGKQNNFGIDDIVEGINYAKDNGADVICMCLGTFYPTKDLEVAVKEASKQCILVAAAGNEQKRAGNNIYGSKSYPAAYPEVIGVMSNDLNGGLSEFSNWCDFDEKSPIYNISAPGENVYSSYLKDEYKKSSGTSQATAFVAASVAVMEGMFYDRSLYEPMERMQIFLNSMKKKTVFDESHGGSHKLLYLPDLMEVYRTYGTIKENVNQETSVNNYYSDNNSTHNQEIESVEETTKESAEKEDILQEEKNSTVQEEKNSLGKTKRVCKTSEKKIKERVKKGGRYLSGKNKTRAYYLVKNYKKKEVYYAGCKITKKVKHVVIPLFIKLQDGRRYKVIGITKDSFSSFSNRRKIKSITLKTGSVRKKSLKKLLKKAKMRKVKIV